MDEKINEPTVEIVVDDTMVATNPVNPPTSVVTTQEAVELLKDQDPQPEKAQEAALSTEKEEKPKPVRDEKGQFLPGNQESKGLTNSGRPCDFCREPFKLLQKTNLYLEFAQGNAVLTPDQEKGPRMPYIEELAEFLGILTETIDDWCDKTHPGHAEFLHAIKRLKQIQKMRLLQRTLRDAPAGAIFQLKANHGMIETEKTVLAGANGEPIEYNINIVPKTKKQIEQENE